MGVFLGSSGQGRPRACTALTGKFAGDLILFRNDIVQVDNWIIPGWGDPIGPERITMK
jgi:hypothetical protein